MEPFTEEEVLKVINDMGYDLSPEELSFFKKEMDRFLDELERGERQSPDGSVSFMSSGVPDEPGGLDGGEMFYAEQYRRLPSYENLDLPKNLRNSSRSLSSANDDQNLDRDAILEILSEGYRCLQNITEDNDCLRDLNNRLEQSLRCSRAKLGFSDECEQIVSGGMDEEQEQNDGEESDSTLVAVDPALRPVLCPLPGGVPFRHDPVKKYELYKKGWTENPPPGEKKRLSLRWKVREFMLRRDVPRVKPADLARRRVSNPSWSPRPYLD